MVNQTDVRKVSEGGCQADGRSRRFLTRRMELQSPPFRIKKAHIALYWPPSCYDPIPTRYFLARDEAFSYKNADLLVTALDLFFRIMASESVLLSGSTSAFKR